MLQLMTLSNPSFFLPSSVAHSSLSSSARIAISPRTAYSASMTAGLMVSSVTTRSDGLLLLLLLDALAMMLRDKQGKLVGIAAVREDRRRSRVQDRASIAEKQKSRLQL